MSGGCNALCVHRSLPTAPVCQLVQLLAVLASVLGMLRCDGPARNSVALVASGVSGCTRAAQAAPAVGHGVKRYPLASSSAVNLVFLPLALETTSIGHCLSTLFIAKAEVKKVQELRDAPDQPTPQWQWPLKQVPLEEQVPEPQAAVPRSGCCRVAASFPEAQSSSFAGHRRALPTWYAGSTATPAKVSSWSDGQLRLVSAINTESAVLLHSVA